MCNDHRIPHLLRLLSDRTVSKSFGLTVLPVWVELWLGLEGGWRKEYSRSWLYPNELMKLLAVTNRNKRRVISLAVDCADKKEAVCPVMSEEA